MKSRKLLITIAVVIGLFIITNPTAKRFKEFCGTKTYSGLKREQNWIIFSVYSEDGYKYLGIVLNFFKLKDTE